ncbi:MAG: starch-binding protein [Candidatus Izemoplasmatales bacterium]|nr:starch-binding protein [Candidatus Izemoplasmatales bacterium]
MKKLFLGLFLIFGLAIGFMNLNPQALEPTYSPITYTYTINKDGVSETPTTITNINYGTSVSFDFGTAPEGYTFIGHINHDKLISTGSNIVSINVTDNTAVEYLFKTTGSTAVIFKDTNLDFVDILLANGSGIITGYPNISSYSKPGLTTTNWTDGTNTYTQTALATQVFSSGTTTILYPLYTTAESLSISVPNGTMTNLSIEEGVYFNDLIQVVANAPGIGYYFDHWEKDGRIVSYDATYTFTVADNHKLAAVYDQIEASSHTGSFVSVSTPYDNLRTGYYTLVGQFDLAIEDSIVEYGFIQSNDVSNPNLGTNTLTTDTDILYSSKYNTETNEFVMSFNKSTAPLKTYYRSFITVINGTAVSTIYSEVVTNTKVWFYNSEGWTNIYGFTKYTGRESLEINDLESWPGTLAIKDGTTDWWYVNVPLVPETQNFTIIFNNNSSQQSLDIQISDSTNIYTAITGAKYSSRDIVVVSFGTYPSDPVVAAWVYGGEGLSDTWIAGTLGNGKFSFQFDSTLRTNFIIATLSQTPLSWDFRTYESAPFAAAYGGQSVTW